MRKLTVLCISLSGTGHVNATLGIGCALRKRGHRVVYAAERSYEGYYETYGFEEKIYDEKENIDKVTSGQQWRKFTIDNVRLLNSNVVDSYQFLCDLFNRVIDCVKYCNARIEEIVKDVKPDVIIEDRCMLPIPALLSSGIPIIKLASVNPLFYIDDENIPPGFFGMPTHDNSQWKQHRKIFRELMQPNVELVNEWFQSLNKQNNNNFQVIYPTGEYREYRSTNLNILIYPELLVADYLKNYTLPPEFMRLDHCMRDSTGTFEIPRKLQNQCGKLIYFSIGTVGASITDVITKFINTFTKSKHRFIISKGDLPDDFLLPENVWGEAFLPQLEVLNVVDLVLTHGGNNTFVESMYAGKPVIVFPLFCDQHDNAQRAVEMGIGYKFNPFYFEEDELLEAIDKLLVDNVAAEKLAKISEQMRESKAMDKVLDRIEFVAEYPKMPTIY